MKKERKEESFIKKPYYKAGGKAFNDFIYGNLKYPAEAVKNKIEGIVICKYDIDHEGYIIDVKVLKGLGYGCDEEAIRVIKMLKFEVPKNPRGLRIIFHKDIKIQFKMQISKAVDSTPPSIERQIQYNIVSSNQNQSKQKPLTQEKKSVNYEYTIQF